MGNYNPICPHDLLNCTDFDMDSYVNCHYCTRNPNCANTEHNYHGVRATGGMPGAEAIYNWIVKLFKKK